MWTLTATGTAYTHQYTRRKFTANSANIWMSDKIETLYKSYLSLQPQTQKSGQYMEKCEWVQYTH